MNPGLAQGRVDEPTPTRAAHRRGTPAIRARPRRLNGLATDLPHAAPAATWHMTLCHAPQSQRIQPQQRIPVEPVKLAYRPWDIVSVIFCTNNHDAPRLPHHTHENRKSPNEQRHPICHRGTERVKGHFSGLVPYHRRMIQEGTAEYQHSLNRLQPVVRYGMHKPPQTGLRTTKVRYGTAVSPQNGFGTSVVRYGTIMPSRSGVDTTPRRSLAGQVPAGAVQRGGAEFGDGAAVRG